MACLSFTSSSHTSNGSIDYSMEYNFSGSEVGSTVAIGKFKPSNNLEQLLSDASSKISDAEILVEGVSVGVQQCMLAARSKFFENLFRKEMENSLKDGCKPRYHMMDMLPYGKVGYEVFLTFLSYLKCGKLKHFPPEVSTCVDSTCVHDSCRPAINFAVELMYASSVFQVPELASLIQRHLLTFVEKALVEDVILMLMVAFHCQSNQLLTRCVDRVARSYLESLCIEKEAPFEVAANIKILRKKFLANENKVQFMDSLYEKRIKRIYKALDCDDVELVKLLVDESNISLDEAFALHYAVAYCDPKVVSELLSLGVADVNLRNSRGYTVLHIAAMRKEPSTILSLLAWGAYASELTVDGQSVVGICRRFTRPKDYHAKTEQGDGVHKDRICIDVLERELYRNPMAGNAIISSPLLLDVLNIKLQVLEYRVAFARLLSPWKAEVAMEKADLESNRNITVLDLNETPMVHKQKLLSRMQVLSKTVELVKSRFPHCCQLNNCTEDDLPDLVYLENGTPEEQQLMRRRMLELKDDIQKAYNRFFALGS